MKNSFSVISFPPCFLWASEKSVYHLLSISTIRKDPQVLNVCSSQPSKSAWPHWKTQKQQNISSLIFFLPRIFQNATKPPAWGVKVSFTDMSHNKNPWIPRHHLTFRELLNGHIRELVGKFLSSHSLRCLHSPDTISGEICGFLTVWIVRVPCELCVLPSASLQYTNDCKSLQGTLAVSHFVDQLLCSKFMLVIISTRGSVYSV